MIKLVCGYMVPTLNVSIGEYESMSKMNDLLSPEDLGKFDSAGSVLINAVFFVASCDHRFIFILQDCSRTVQDKLQR